MWGEYLLLEGTESYKQSEVSRQIKFTFKGNFLKHRIYGDDGRIGLKWKQSAVRVEAEWTNTKHILNPG
jgi:hypothetical protein